MRKTLLAVAITVLAALPMSAFADDICDAVNETANGWTELGNLLDESKGDGFSAEEIESLSSVVADLTALTQNFANLLQTGNDEQVTMGAELEGTLSVLADDDAAEDVNYLVSVMDQVTDKLDSITDACDAGN